MYSKCTRITRKQQKNKEYTETTACLLTGTTASVQKNIKYTEIAANKHITSNETAKEQSNKIE